MVPKVIHSKEISPLIHERAQAEPREEAPQKNPQ